MVTDRRALLAAAAAVPAPACAQEEVVDVARDDLPPNDVRLADTTPSIAVRSAATSTRASNSTRRSA